MKAIGENPRSIGASGRPNDCSQVCIQIASIGCSSTAHDPPRCPRRGAVRRSAHLSPVRSVAHARRHQSKKQPKRSVLHLPSRRWTRTRVVPHASATVSGDAILKASATLAAHGASAAASWWAEAPHPRGSGLNASAISSSQNRMWQQHGPCRTTRRTADGSRTAQIASHGRLTACRSRLMRYPDRADDRRASLFLRRGALCILACVVQGILCA